MTTGSTGTRRRTLLQRGFALLAGGAAIGGGSRWVTAASPPAADASLTVYARRRPVAGVPGAFGPQHAADGRVLSSGDLLDDPMGQSIGTFYTNTFCVASPFGGQAAAESSLEFHVLQLVDGTLFSIGSGGDNGKALAIVGGTGRYAGRSGSCVERAVAGARATDDVRELTVTFAG